MIRKIFREEKNEYSPKEEDILKRMKVLKKEMKQLYRDIYHLDLEDQWSDQYWPSLANAVDRAASYFPDVYL